ncbi:Dynein axonemal intermediate chain 3 [Anthophora plagiata]
MEEEHEDRSKVEKVQSVQVEQTEQHEQSDGKTRNVNKSEESVQAESRTYDDDFGEYGGYEYTSKDAKEREGDEAGSVSTGTIDWEKEAKETIRLDPAMGLRERRKTIYELDSYASAGPSESDLMKLTSKDYVPEVKKPKIRYSVSLGAPGIARINLSPLTQKVVGCVIGENVSTEYPWVYVRKEIIEDNIDLHEDSSDFLPIKDEIRKFPNSKLLIGYVPSLTEEGQFYICLTEKGRDVVVEHIQKQREEHENRVRTAVYKPLGEWKELGSGMEIQTAMIKNMRPLLEIEVVGTADVLNTVLDLEDRKVDDVRDGYIELLPYRQTFKNVERKLIHIMTQVTPAVRDTEAQTALSVPTNCWVQYEYEYKSPDIAQFNEVQLESLKSFLERFTDKMCDQLLLNATWDIYTNDYANLVRNIRDTQWPIPVSYEEHLSFHDEKHVVDKVINDLCWHPLWSGIAFAAYTSYAKSQHLVGPKSDKEVIKASEDNYVLVWSFNDCLSPKLVLECPREVTSVAVNPLDGNLVVGGCGNGQLIIWHIPGKIEKVESVVVHTAAQIKHKITIKSLTTWMQEPLGLSLIRPTAMSSLKNSQKGAVTQIIWFSPYNTLDMNGRIQSLPEDTSVEDLSSQFVTASEDGTIAFWDLKDKRWSKYEKKSRPKKKGQAKRPEALTKSISPFKKLDRIFKPHYLLTIQLPNESRNAVITTITIFVQKFKKECVDTIQPTDDITVRRTFRNIIKKPDFVMQPRIHVGTVEGDFGCITWEGYDFTTDLAINTETCTWCWIKKVHDGPITHSVRSREDGSLIATIGGKIFALWKEDLGIPLIWKKSDVTLTAISWGSFRPTILILTRIDGSVELWDFMVKSEEPCVLQSLSGRIITGIYTHELTYTTTQCVGFCDFNGILRMFLAPTIFLKTDITTFNWMKNFVERQITRVKNCKNWQDAWLEANQEIIEEAKRLKQMEEEKKKQMEEEKRATTTAVEVEAVVEIQKRSLKSWEIIEESRERWKARELKHMQQVILEKKGLKKEDLEKQREPILKLRQEERRKKQRLREALQMQETIFEHTKSLFFPKHQTEPRRISIVPPGKVETVTVEDKILAQEDMHQVDPNEEIVYHFMETQAKVLNDLQKTPFQHTFNWKEILMKGRIRRLSLDTELRKLNKTRKKRKS